MAEIPKRLGANSALTANTATNLVDNGATANTYTIFSSIVGCNTDGTNTYTIDLSVSATSATHGAYIAKGVSIRPNDAISYDKVVLDPTNRYLVVSVSNAAVHVSAFGVQGP
jgi:hypothetical protein